jgi:integrase
MPRPIHRLTARAVVVASKRGLLADGGGLFLQIARNGSKSWLFRYARAGRTRHMGLGPTHTVTLAEARERARECRSLLANGHDPLDKRAHERVDSRSITFDECASSYIATHKNSWRNAKHAVQWQSTLQTYVSPAFGDAPVDMVKVADVLRVVEPLWSAKPETASRVRGRVEAILDWASARGLRSGDNPARWRGHLDKLLPAKAKVRPALHHASLEFTETAAFIADLRKRTSVAAAALEFLILTAARTNEVLGAEWSEIDVNSGVWTVPATRMKAGKQHRVPLPQAAISILERMSPTSQFVFAGPKGRPLSNMALLALLKRMGRTGITVHGFRSTFRTWASERTSVQREVAEAALAHSSGSKVEQAYQRGDLFLKRKQLMRNWAEFCNRVAAPVQQKQVVSLFNR